MNTENTETLRRFLLNDVDEEERERIENRFITDQHERELILAAEEDLAEAYLEGDLSRDDQEKFEAIHNRTNGQQRGLRFLKALKKHAAAELG